MCHAPHQDQHRNNPGYTNVLWLVLIINAAMFLTELIMGFASGSVSLQADALDFMGDAASYGISLMVASLALVHRARAALLNGISMACSACGFWAAHSGMPYTGSFRRPARWVLSEQQPLLRTRLLSYSRGRTEPVTATCSRFGSARETTWLEIARCCSLHLVCLGPDIVVALVMGLLALQGAWLVSRTASRELTGVRA